MIGTNSWLGSRLMLMAYVVNMIALGYCLFGNF